VALAIRLFFQGPGAVPAGAPWTARKDFYRAEVPLDATDCDAKIHQQYVEQFIAGQADGDSEGSRKAGIQDSKRSTRDSGRPFHPQV